VRETDRQHQFVCGLCRGHSSAAAGEAAIIGSVARRSGRPHAGNRKLASGIPLSSECGTYKTVRVRFGP